MLKYTTNSYIFIQFHVFIIYLFNLGCFGYFFFGDEFIPPINFGLLSGKRKKQLPGHKDVINKSYGSCNNDRTHNCASNNLCLSRDAKPYYSHICV